MTITASQLGVPRATTAPAASLRRVAAGVLDVRYAEAGPTDGPPVLLLHGWPYDIHAFDEIMPMLAARGFRVIAPHLRGHGPTRFLSAETREFAQAIIDIAEA